MTPEARLAQLGIKLAPPGKPGGIYKPAVVASGLIFVSGHGPVREDGTMVTGRVGEELNLEQARQAARLVGIAILGTLRAQLGSLDRVRCLVKTLGMVNAVPGYTQQPQVINGYSELMVEIFGPDLGVGARSAVGMGSLPGNIPVEIECIFEVTV